MALVPPQSERWRRVWCWWYDICLIGLHRLQIIFFLFVVAIGIFAVIVVRCEWNWIYMKILHWIISRRILLHTFIICFLFGGSCWLAHTVWWQIAGDFLDSIQLKMKSTDLNRTRRQWTMKITYPTIVFLFHFAKLTFIVTWLVNIEANTTADRRSQWWKQWNHFDIILLSMLPGAILCFTEDALFGCRNEYEKFAMTDSQRQIITQSSTAVRVVF